MMRRLLLLPLLLLWACDDDPRRHPNDPGAGGTGGSAGSGGSAGTGGSAGGGIRGDRCDDELPCDAGHTCENGRCFPLCDPADGDATCGEGLRCRYHQQESGDPLGVCEPSVCESDADCAADQSCSVVTRPDGSTDTACTFRVGEDPAGTPCTSDESCASGICLPELQVCYGVCATDADCADGGACLLRGFSRGGQSVPLPLCVSDCIDDEGCGPGLACALVDTRAQALRTVCLPEVGSVQAGGTCTQNEDCRTGYCHFSWDGTTGLCDGGCSDDADCAERTECVDVVLPSSGADGVWGTDDDWQSYPRCRGESCTSRQDCGDWACRSDLEEVDGVAVKVNRCFPPSGPGGVGAACLQGCASGTCIQRPEMPPEDCSNGIDDDGDGAVDCTDLDCRFWCGSERRCSDGLDDDGDGFVDCADLDCEGSCTTESCANGVDDDGNGLIDAEDPGCFFEVHEIMECGNRKDDDGDGLMDCDDPDCCLIDWEDLCRGTRACAEKVCADGRDDDGDGRIDCADSDCNGRPGCIETDCTNGFDEDGDGLVDCADRFDCGPNPACVESACGDGVDNDADLLVDCFDPDCAFVAACDESGCAGGDCCTNGVDDDGDGRVDCQDGNCAWGPVCNESACGGEDCCGDGIDQDGDGAVDCADRDCALTSACDEGLGFDGGSCIDGLDQDGDGLVDCDDPDCADTLDCKVCYEPCLMDADCGEGARCVPGAGIEVPPFEGTFEYVGTCVAN